jgi:hypothetical protein
MPRCARSSPVVWVVAAAIASLAGRQARAGGEVITDLSPTVGIGATDNVTTAGGVTERTSDGFGTAGGALRLRYEGARSTSALSYRLLWTRYVESNIPATIFSSLAVMSSLAPTATLNVQLHANVDVTRASNFDPANPTLVSPTAAAPGTSLYLATTAGEDLGYQPNSRRGYGESLSVSQVRYLETAMPLPTTTFVSGAARATRLVGREVFTLDVAVGDSFTTVEPALMQGTFAQGHTILAQALVGWRHEVSPYWTTQLQAGPSMIAKLSGTGVIAPAATATISYARTPWIASASAVQSPAPNLFFGDATITDQAIVRLALPVLRSELVYVGGFGGYLYGRIANDQLQLSRDFDQFVAGLSLFARFGRMPFAGSVNYMVLSQRGSSLPGHEIPDLARQAVMVNITGVLAWGKGTPPLFAGAL